MHSVEPHRSGAGVAAAAYAWAGIHTMYHFCRESTALEAALETLVASAKLAPAVIAAAKAAEPAAPAASSTQVKALTHCSWPPCGRGAAMQPRVDDATEDFPARNPQGPARMQLPNARRPGQGPHDRSAAAERKSLELHG